MVYPPSQSLTNQIYRGNNPQMFCVWNGIAYDRVTALTPSQLHKKRVQLFALSAAVSFVPLHLTLGFQQQ
ncbi:MAG: hypothetical protein KME28_09365 [Pelatocladus maniniholoensis HA4357-MV3]|jgi:hypothetical protein|uniref:Uncharacterized protein n=1 Tax=Pelatocladus maniniholoensis HA4357-MV3 TaxID=1117104 RepID=A0A9E3H7S3_9NOST|nr:hypothetical protein [Pelatocladus maniniholoensis HA4357-MV3]